MQKVKDFQGIHRFRQSILSFILFKIELSVYLCKYGLTRSAQLRLTQPQNTAQLINQTKKEHFEQ